MKTSSCKAKGRRCASFLRDLLLKYTELAEDDITVTPSGVNGPDLQLSNFAKKFIPFDFECKNVEKLNIWKALEQAEKRSELIPAVVFKRNRSKIYIALELEEFLKLKYK